MSKILISVVSYCNEEEVIKFAQMLSQQTNSSEICLVITVNARSNGIILENEMNRIDLSIEIYDPKENLGYLNGSFYGYNEHLKKHVVKPDWLIISNTDIIVKDREFINKLLGNDYNDDIWCIAPSVYSPNNKSFDNPHYKTRCSLNKINSIIWINERPLFAFFYSELARIKAKLKKKSKQASQYVYSAHGCFFILKRDFSEIIKDFSYEGFLYSEEAYIAENILLNDKKCFYDESLNVIHNENSVTGLLSIKMRSKFIASSLKYIKNEFYLK